MQLLLDAGVASRRGIMCSHREAAYDRDDWSCGRDKTSCDCSQSTCVRLVESERAQDSVIILPLFHDMTQAEQDEVVDALCSACTA